MLSRKRCALPVITTMALRQLMHLGNLTLKKDEVEVAAQSWL